MTIEKLALGTVQFGLDYGITNKHGLVMQECAGQIIDRYCEDMTVPLLDTAACYGTAEQVIGSHLANSAFYPEIVTKINCPLERVRDEFNASLARLGGDRVYGLLIHDASALLGPSGKETLKKLRSFKERGWVKKIGASVYDADQIEAFLKFNELDLIQIPFSILDNRLERSGHLARLQDAGVEVHARSVFLQGVTLMSPDDMPDFLAGLRPCLEDLDKNAAKLDMSRLELALSFVLSQPTIDRIVVGVTNLPELEEIITAVKKADSRKVLDIPLENIPYALVDPRTWNQYTK